MLMGGDFDLNSEQQYTDSPEEVLKQIMLQHETIFGNQVYELHRLYRIQQTLMKDLSRKELDKYNSWTGDTKSVPLPFQDSQNNKTMVGSTSSTNWNLLDCKGSYSKPQQKALDLQLSADEYISNVGNEFPKKGNFGPTVKESGGTKELLCANHVPDPEEVKLSLSTGGGRSDKGFSSRSWYNKETFLSTPYVIDSEESIERKSKEQVKPIFSITSESPTTSVGEKHGVLAPFLSDLSFSGRLKKDIGHHPFMNNHSLANQSGRYQEDKSCCSHTGLNEHQSSGQHINLFTSKRISSSCDITRIDLNRVQLGESSCFSNDPSLSFPFLTENSPAIIHGLTNKSNNGTRTFMTTGINTDDSFSDETSTSIVLQQDNSAYSALKDSMGKLSDSQACNMRPKCIEKCGYKGGVIDLEQEPEDPSHWEDICDQDVKLSKEVIDFSLGLPNDLLYKNYQPHALDVTLISKVASNQLHTSLRYTDSLEAVDDAEDVQINFASSEEDTLSSGLFRIHAEFQTEHCKSSDATSKTNCWTGNNSCYIKDLQSGAVGKGEVENSKSASSEESGATLLGSQITETQSSEGKGELENSRGAASAESGTTLLKSGVTEAHSSEQDTIVETGVYTCACTEESPSDGTKKEHQCHSLQQNVVAEMDILIQNAAESLIHISLDNPFCPQDCFGEEVSNALEEERSEQAEYSSDSFESITLRLTECSADDYLVKLMPIEVNANETQKGCGWKLKRGSRLKDFRKDILPGLVSLSRHEICEDINIFEAVLRSKEYRKNRSRNIGGEDWSVPVKRRRSKLNFSGRRMYY